MSVRPSPTAFFYRHAGYSYPQAATPVQQRAHRLNGARALAKAEADARDAGISFDWAIDHGSTSADWSDEKSAWCQWRCIARNAEGLNVASLWGIDFGRDGDPWGDPYRRVVEAELATEALS